MLGQRLPSQCCPVRFYIFISKLYEILERRKKKLILIADGMETRVRINPTSGSTKIH